MAAAAFEEKEDDEEAKEEEEKEDNDDDDDKKALAAAIAAAAAGSAASRAPPRSCLDFFTHGNEMLFNFLQVHVFLIPIRVLHTEQHLVCVRRAPHHLPDERAVPDERLAHIATHQL